MTWYEGVVGANGIRIHYSRTGGAKPQVVLAHGAGDDGLYWTRVAMVLEDTYDVVMPDARGHGRTTGGVGDYSTDARVADMAAFIEALDLTRPAIGGHSMGADTGLHLAAYQPDLVSRLVLEDPPMVLPGESMFGGRIGERMGNSPKLMLTAMRVARALPRGVLTPVARKAMPGCPDDEIIPWVNSKKRVQPAFLKTATTMLDDRSALEAIGKMTAPTLLFRGDRELGAIVSGGAADAAADALPSLQVVHLAGVGHDIRRGQFTAYMAAVTEFLDRTAGGS
jgi:pimeloyl-ACP methyl ester carboxylesterase